MAENVERSNFDYIEEARGLQQMLEMTNGNQTQAAEKLQKSKQWFSQRIGLLRLSEEMQALVISGELKAFRDMRMYSALPPSDQSPTPAPSPMPVPAPRLRERPPHRHPNLSLCIPRYTHPPVREQAQSSPSRAEEPLSAESPGTVRREVLPVPVPRDAAPEPPEVEPPPAAPKQKQVLAANWERWFDRLMEELPELDRHMLTKKLQRVMLSEMSRVEGSQA